MKSITFGVASLLCASLLVSAGLGAQSADRTRTEALARRAAERLQALHAEADRLAAEERTVLGDLRRLEVQRQIKTEELRKIEADASAAQAELASLDAQLKRLEAQDAKEGPELRARIVELYKLGRGRYLRLLLSTSDVRRVGQASRMVAAVARQDRERVASYQKRIEAMRAARGALQDRTKKLAALRASTATAQAAVSRAVQARNDLVREIDRRRDLTAQLAGELQGAQQKLQLTLRTLASGGTAVEPARLPLRPFQGDLEWPVPGGVRQRFGAGAAVRGAAANGIEIAAAEGAPVHAVHEGTVAFSGPFEGFGRLVILDHGGQTFSLYGYLLEAAVAQGARLDRGQGVGTVGLSTSGEPALYFELRVDGRPVDPLQWLKRR